MNGPGGRWQAAGVTAANQRFARHCTLRAVLFPIPQSAFRIRSAVTLVELLITIAIIATLSAVFLGASNSAMELSRRSRTKTTIARIDTLLMERWASYATRRVDVTIPSGTLGPAAALIRLRATRELMKREMPDRWSDLLIGTAVKNQLPSSINSAPSTVPVPGFATTITYPSLTKSYLRRYSNLPDDEKIIEDNQGAECLYMIIMLATGDGEARTLFNQQDIGDTDGDGAPEFLDGWGRPIHFLRWPAGFAEAGLSSLMPADADADHDPFDYFRRDNPPNPIGLSQNTGYRLVPLIYSGGPDGDPDLYTAKRPPIDDPYDEVSSLDPPIITAKIGTPMSPLDPPYGIGTVDNEDGDNWHDNIHNHLLEGR